MEKAADASATTSKSGNGNTSSEIPVFMDGEFYEAAVEGNIDAFKEKGEDIEFILTPNENTILHMHLTNYKVSKTFAREILHICPSLVMKVNKKRENLLHIAARFGRSTTLKILIEHVKALSQDIDDEVGIVKKLIRKGNHKEDTALHEAVRFRHITVVDILTKEDPDHPYYENCTKETPLYLAAERAYGDVVQKILENCKVPNQNGPNSRTALHAAVIRNDREMVSKLLTRTSAKQKDDNGWLPLHLAAFQKSPDLAEMLLKYDRSAAYVRDNRGRTALHFAARSGNVKVMGKIMEYCPDCSELGDQKGYNALHYSASRGIFEVNAKDAAKATKIVLKNASLSNLYNEEDDNGNKPLHCLAKTYARSDEDEKYHPLLDGYTRVDAMAFNKHNQTVLDVAYEEHHPYYFSKQLREIGAMYGGRVKNMEDRKVRQEKRHDFANDRKEEQEKMDNPMDKLRDVNLVVATLIATVTFAAGFTLPGGTVQEHDQPDKGSAMLRPKPAFQAFIVTGTISFVLSASAVFLQIFLTSPRMRYNTSFIEI